MAQPAGAQAEVLFREGRNLMAAGKIAEACNAFEQSQKLDPTVSTLVNLAGCREKNGQLATAWGLFLDAERQTRSATDADGKKLHSVAADRAKKLEARVSKLTINVPEKSVVDGLEVLRDRDRVDKVMWNRALPVDGGTYTITARSPGSNDWSTKITVGNEADTKTVEIPDLRHLPRDLAQKQVVQEPAKPVTAEVGEEELEDEGEEAAPASGGSKVVPIAVTGAAVGLLGGALGMHLWGNATYDDAKAEMTDQARRDELYDSANTKRYLAQGLGVAGLATAGVAVWLWLRSPGESPTAATARRRSVVVSPTGIAIIGAF
jgi:hypothetical protein